MAKGKETTVATLDHLIRVCETCVREGKHLNPESLAVILRRIRTDMKRVGRDNDRASAGV